MEFFFGTVNNKAVVKTSGWGAMMRNEGVAALNEMLKMILWPILLILWTQNERVVFLDIFKESSKKAVKKSATNVDRNFVKALEKWTQIGWVAVFKNLEPLPLNDPDVVKVCEIVNEYNL